MWVTVLSILAYLVPFILEAWTASRPAAKKEAQDEVVQKGREDIVLGDVAAVNARVDGLLSGGGLLTEGAAGSGGAPGQHLLKSPAERLSDLLGEQVVSGR